MPEIAGVDGDQHVGGRVLAFGLQALHQGAGLVGYVVDLDAGLSRVGIEQRFDQMLLAGRVDDQIFGQDSRFAKQGEAQSEGEKLGKFH